MNLNRRSIAGVLALIVGVFLVEGLRGADDTHAEDDAVRDFVNRYFKTWSAADMDAYGACFHPQARISFLDTAGVVSSIELLEFLESQKKAHQKSKWPMTSSPTDVSIGGDKSLMHVRAKWVLKIDRREERGVDFITLVRQEQEWKIIALVFHAE